MTLVHIKGRTYLVIDVCRASQFTHFKNPKRAKVLYFRCIADRYDYWLAPNKNWIFLTGPVSELMYLLFFAESTRRDYSRTGEDVLLKVERAISAVKRDMQ